MKALLLIVLLPAAAAAQQAALTLDQAVAAALANSKTLQASAARAEAASAKASGAKAAYLPVIAADAGYRRLSDIDPFQVGPPVFPRTIVISPAISDNYTAHASIQQPLFTGFRISANARAAEDLADAGASDLSSDRADAVLGATSAYWMLYQTREVKKAVDENVARLDAYRKDTERLVAAGLATRNDLLKIDVQLANARVGAIDAANDRETALMTLNKIMGRPLDEDHELASLPGASAAAGDTGIAESAALARRPDLDAMRLRVEAAREGITAAQSGFWPQLFAGANYLYARPNPRILPARDEFIGTWDVGVTLQWTLWNWGGTGAQSEEARATLRQNESLYGEMRDAAALDIRRTRLAVARAAEKINVANVAISQAEENARTNADKFKQGLATSTDLLDASVALLQARTNLTAALVEHEIAAARLARATGVPAPPPLPGETR